MLYTGIFGDKPAILDIASTFGGEDFTEVNAESLDAVAEFLNVNNGLYVTAMSGEWIELDLEPPMMYPEQKTISSEGIAYRIQVYLSGKKVNIVFSLNTDVSVD